MNDYFSVLFFSGLKSAQNDTKESLLHRKKNNCEVKLHDLIFRMKSVVHNTNNYVILPIL